MQNTESAILDLFFARDERAIEAAIREYGTYCMSIAVGVLRQTQDAEECVNDTWLKAWNSITPQRPSPLRAWLGKVTRNLALSRYRYNHAARRDSDMTACLEELENCIPLRDEDAGHLPALMDQFLGTLQPTDRKLFVGRYWYRYPSSALAKGYGLTETAVNTRLSRIRDRLRTFLEKEGWTV